MRDSPFCKMFSVFSPLFCFEQEKTLKNFSKKLYTVEIKKKKEEAATKSSAWDLKNAWTNSNSQTVLKAVRGRYVYRSFSYSDHCIKQIDSILPWVCSVIDNRGRQNVVKTSVAHEPQLHCFYHILTSSVIYYWTDAGQHGIYLLSDVFVISQ